MNTLSWMLYTSELSNNVSGLCVAITAIALISGVVSCIAHIVYADDNLQGEAEAECKSKGWRLLRLGVAVAITAAIIATILPSQKTVLMIAASELGQRAYDDPSNQPVINALKAAITAKLNEVSK